MQLPRAEESALPVEIIQYAHEHVRRQVESLPSLSGCQAKLRLKEDQSPYVTDNGNYIVDLHFRSVLFVCVYVFCKHTFRSPRCSRAPRSLKDSVRSYL